VSPRRVPASLLTADGPRAVRLIARGLVHDVLEAAAEHDDRGGRRTLHAVRVAMRRARSWLRVHREVLDGAGRGRAVRALERAGAASGAARDAEVFQQWLTAQRSPLPPAARRAGRWLVEHWGHGEVPAEPTRVLPVVEAPLQRLLERTQRYAHVVDVDTGPVPRPMAGWTASVLRRQRDVLRARFAAVTVGDDATAAHRVRVACKQLRYTLEPLAPHVPGAPALIAQCTTVQDALGELRDAQVASATLTRLAGVATAEPPDASVLAGLPVLAVSLAARVREAWRVAQPLLHGAAGEALLDAVGAVAEALDALARRGTEIERKYLCTAMPVLPPGVSVQHIEQGYLPGTELVERVRRVREGRRTQRYRTVKLGRGLQRQEVEERCSAALFEALWPFTAERRVLKRRHVVVEGPHTWVVDEFTDRALVLVEIELPRLDTVVALPPWLTAVLDREVTDESAYVNAVLAC